LVRLRGAKVGKREHGVVITRLPERLEPATHFSDRSLYAALATGNAVVGAGWDIGVGQSWQERSPVDEDRRLSGRWRRLQRHGKRDA
jgi:hypothetical protein